MNRKNHTPTNKGDLVLVTRLVKLTVPFADMRGCNKKLTKSAFQKYKGPPCGYRSEDTRSNYKNDPTAYDFARVWYFRLALRGGKRVKPICVETKWDPLDWGDLVIMDGYHRLIAHVLEEVPTIRICFTGFVPVLEYLTGSRKKLPRP
jgi:hypothetical protein